VDASEAVAQITGRRSGPARAVAAAPPTDVPTKKKPSSRENTSSQESLTKQQASSKTNLATATKPTKSVTEDKTVEEPKAKIIHPAIPDPVPALEQKKETPDTDKASPVRQVRPAPIVAPSPKQVDIPANEESDMLTQTSRPRTAKRAPPKIKLADKVQATEVPKEAPTVILDQTAHEDVDDDEQLVQIAAPEVTTNMAATQEFGSITNEAVDHGGLVKKILETNKQLSGESQESALEASASGRNKERQALKKEVLITSSP